MILSKSGGNDSKAREMADSLYADLYGLRESSDGSRRSLFDYFHGRSKLSTWLTRFSRNAISTKSAARKKRIHSTTPAMATQTHANCPR